MPAQGMWTGLTWALLLTSFTATSSKQYAFHMWAIVQTAIDLAMQILACRLKTTKTQIWQYKLSRNVTLLSFRYRHSDPNGNLKPPLHNLFKAGLLHLPVLYKLWGGEWGIVAVLPLSWQQRQWQCQTDILCALYIRGELEAAGLWFMDMLCVQSTTRTLSSSYQLKKVEKQKSPNRGNSGWSMSSGRDQAA